MAERRASPGRTAPRAAKQSKPQTAARQSRATTGFSAEERAAMKDHVQEMKAARSGKSDGEADVLAKIAEMPDADRVMAERLHAIIKEAAPTLMPRTWYGMPAYAKDGNVVCFFQGRYKFKARYATLGFNHKAALDDGVMWPTSFALTELTDAAAAAITALVKKAMG